MNLLTIGGSDPSGGAGIQSDLKTFEELNSYGLTIITAITAQNTMQFNSVQPVSKKMIIEQIDSVFSDFKIDGIKISMVYNSEIIKTIYEKLKDKKIPIIIDPIIESTTNGQLLEKTALKDYKKFIVPLATIITPNKFEAEFLTKIKIKSKKTLLESAKKIQKMGAKNVIITGIEEGTKVSDFVLERTEQYFVSSKKITRVNHGSGCNYSSALIFEIASGKTIKKSAKFAKNYTFDSIRKAKNIGKGIAITLNKNPDKSFEELRKSILKFTSINKIYKKIPECQTNFVFSKEHPKTINDVLGIQGRIVKTGEKVLVAGNIEYGGSKHVATALIAMNKKFPHIRSAVNLKYNAKTISKIKNNFKISSYDRTQEPKGVKNEGSSVGWGIKMAIKKCNEAPDIIYHKGDFGKEPMIIVFGENPTTVLQKITKMP